MTSTQVIAATLAPHTFLAANELELHEGIAAVLARAGIGFVREVRLDARSRVDFLTDDGVAIEVKVDGSAEDVGRQLERYAQHERVTGVVLASSRSKHWPLRALKVIAGKPFVVVWLGGVP